MSSPTQMQELIEQLFEGVVCMAETLAGIDPKADTPKGERFVNATAIYAAKQRDAFMTQGFTREEAVALVGTQLSMLKLNTAN